MSDPNSTYLNQILQCSPDETQWNPGNVLFLVLETDTFPVFRLKLIII